jgi:hypothetical protein
MTKISRRGAIGIGAAGVIGLKAGIATAQSATPTLTAVVTLAGVTYEFKEENGQDLGDFVSTIGNFTQRCIRSEVANSPLTVFFRPDRNSDRVEVVFELGRIFSTTPANLGAYSVTIYRGAQVLTRVDIAAHYWFSRWRWQSSPRPAVGNVATMAEQNLIPIYDRSAAPPPAPPALRVMPLPNGDYLDLDILAQFSAGSYANASKLVITAQQYVALNSSATTTATVSTSSSIYAAMGLAGVTPYMPNTGERPDIGLMTEPQAKFICTSDQASLDLLRAQAEAAGTMPWHMRDETQTGPFDFRKYPRATWYWSSNGGSPHVKTTTTPITLDSAHQPALAYLPYLLTGDPYHLEDLQFQATWNWGSLPAAYRPGIPQARAFAWSLRTLAQAARITPAATPSWLLPQSYWTDMLATHRNWFEDNYVDSIRPERLVFRATAPIDSARGETNAPEGTWVDPWQDEFVATVFGWMVAMGFTEWRTAFDWIIGGTIARTSQTSGWIRAHATPYRLILRATKTSPLATSWIEAWPLQQSIGKLTYTDPNRWGTNDLTYLTYTRGALVYAVKFGTPGASENLAWATDQLKTRGWNTAHKWRLGTGL